MTEQWLKCVAATYSKSSDTLNIGVKSNHKGLTFKALVAVTDGIVFRGAKAYTCSKAPSSLGYDFVLSIKLSAVSVEPSAETSAHTLIESLNKRIVKKMGECDRGKWILQEDFEKAFAKQEKAKPDGTGYTADLAYNGLWVGLVRVNGEIDEHDFLVVSVLGKSVLEAALGTLHRSYRAVKAMPTVTEVAIPSKLSLENTNFRSPYAAAYVIRRDNAWIGADGMIRRLNDLITREASNFGDAYTRRLQDRGGSNGPVWYRSVEAAKFFMELNVEPVAPKSEQPKAADKPRKWIEFIKPSDNDAMTIYVKTSLGTQSLINAAINAYMTATQLAAEPPRLVGCPAVLPGPDARVFIKFGEDWREGRLKNFIDGLNAFVERAFGLDPTNPTVKTCGKTAALWKLAEDMRGPKKLETKEPAAKTWRVGEWLEYCSYGKLDGLPGQEKFEINFATIPLRELDLTTVKMVVGAFHIDRLGNNGGPGVSVEELNDVEFNGKKFGTAYRLTVPYDVFQALYCTANPVSGLDKFIAETFRSKAEPAEAKKPEAKKPEAKRAVWGAGSGSLFEDAG